MRTAMGHRRRRGAWGRPRGSGAWRVGRPQWATVAAVALGRLRAQVGGSRPNRNGAPTPTPWDLEPFASLDEWGLPEPMVYELQFVVL